MLVLKFFLVEARRRQGDSIVGDGLFCEGTGSNGFVNAPGHGLREVEQAGGLGAISGGFVNSGSCNQNFFECGSDFSAGFASSLGE